jgi:hypothetical protein
MILQTGGTALGEISTKSKPSVSAISIALGVETTIGALPSTTNLTSGTRIFWFILCCAVSSLLT